MIMDGPPAVALALASARAGIMGDQPRGRSEAVLPWTRLRKVAVFGFTMMVGTLGVLYHPLTTGSEHSALTLAFTTFVLFQFFNVFNARVEHGSTFTSGFFTNQMLWGSLAAVIGLQVLAVHWAPAQSIFGTTALSANQWAMAVGVASSVLWLEEGRKAVVRLFYVAVARGAPSWVRGARRLTGSIHAGNQRAPQGVIATLSTPSRWWPNRS